MEEKLIIFVCTGNTCRSPMAEAIMKSECRRRKIEDVKIISAGLQVRENGFININSARVLSENGLSLENFTPRIISNSLIKDAYVVICMTDEQRDYLIECNSVFNSDIAKNDKIYAFSDYTSFQIPDPYGKSIDEYRITFDKLNEGIKIIIDKLFAEKETKEKPEKVEEVKKKTSSKTKKTTGQKTSAKKSSMTKSTQGRKKKSVTGTRKKAKNTNTSKNKKKETDKKLETGKKTD